MSTASPAAPGRLGAAGTVSQMLTYLGELEQWLSQTRAELDALDAQILASGRQAELTADMTLAMTLWQAAKARQGLLLTTWDSGRVGAKELDQLTALIWGRLDTSATGVTAQQATAVSLPEAGRLCDALLAQLRLTLDSDPNATALQVRLRELRAQLERIRDQVGLEPPALAPQAAAKLAGLAGRCEELVAKQARGGDIAGSLAALEIDAARLERDLIVGGARRREARDLLTRARERLAQVRATEAAVGALASRAAATLWPAPAVDIPSSAELGPLPNTAAALTGYVQRLDDLSTRLGTAQQSLGDRLAALDRAAGLLDALTAKADGLGWTDDQTLTELAGLAARQLAAAPVVLATVEAVLTAYSAQLDYLARSER